MKKLISLVYIFSSFHLFAQTEFNHPRGLILHSEIKTIQSRIKKEPFTTFYKDFLSVYNHLNYENDLNYYCEKSIGLSYLNIFTGSKLYADSAYFFAQKIASDSVFMDPFSRGLTRADALMNLALVYDLCYNDWNEKQRKTISENLIFCTQTTCSNMGLEANYAIESNWMGIRWGATFFASMVTDDYQSNDLPKSDDYKDERYAPKKYSRLKSLEWDSKERMKDHLIANVFPGGWNTESLSYQTYDWSHTLPALVAQKHQFPDVDIMKLMNPNSSLSIWSQAICSVSMLNYKNANAIQPDLSDDDPQGSAIGFIYSCKLWNDSIFPYSKFMLDYLFLQNTNKLSVINYLPLIAYYPETVVAQNPKNTNWLNFADLDQGIAIFRNNFDSHQDVVSLLNATQTRKNGHQGSDNNTFRIIGLGSIWVMGPGRSGRILGQTSLFPIKPSENQLNTKTEGKLLLHCFENDGSGFAIASGSCMGVENQQRFFQVDYSKQTGVPAVFIVADSSTNGKVWRINTLESNEIKIYDDGFLLTAENGNTLRATVYNYSKTLKIDTGRVEYAYGNNIKYRQYYFNGKRFTHTKYIDVNCNGNITVAMTLQNKNEKIPKVNIAENGLKIEINSSKYLVKRYTNNSEKFKTQIEKLKKVDLKNSKNQK